MLPLSPEPMRSSTGNSIESVEQPWIERDVGLPHAGRRAGVMERPIAVQMNIASHRAMPKFDMDAQQQPVARAGGC
jgi:hypothetical protein